MKSRCISTVSNMALAAAVAVPTAVHVRAESPEEFRVVVLSNPFGLLQAASGFNGAAGQADYSRDEIATQDGSTLIVDVHGFRCDSNAPLNRMASKQV